MSVETDNVLIIKGVISDLSKEDVEKVHATADAIRKLVADAGDYGSVALALVGAEMATAAED